MQYETQPTFGNAEVRFLAEKDQKYYLVVEFYEDADEFTFPISLECSPCEEPCTADCPIVRDITCSDVEITGNTGQDPEARSDLLRYSCVEAWETPHQGPELVYRFHTGEHNQLPYQVDLAFDQTPPDGDLDIFVLDSTCSESGCIVGGYDSDRFRAEPNKVYYIVVDGYGDAASSFTLNLDCSASN
jgi:hypothetical protein